MEETKWGVGEEISDMRQSLYANTLLLEILFWRNVIPVKIPLRKDEKGRHSRLDPVDPKGGCTANRSKGNFHRICHI